ncbi:hypothetical protein GCM10009416_11630 [Craurococcus roseus]|uniref:Secreted protein n=1 Tax=Craurococcus roseus TaxID=77585 RepID=A0ABN1EUA2_9PROT
MSDQLLGWLAWACVVLSAATVFLHRLSAFLDALNKAVASFAGVVVSSRAFRDAVRPAVRLSAEPDRKAAEKGKRRSKRRSRPTDRP